MKTNTNNRTVTVIQTQIQENYGAHNWDGEGECPTYWKAKGGKTYVLHGGCDITEFLDTVEKSDNYFDEYAYSQFVSTVEAIHTISEDWETVTHVYPHFGPAEIGNGVLDSSFLMEEVYPLSDSSNMAPFVQKSVTWVQPLEGEARDREVVYMHQDGRMFSYEEAEKVVHTTRQKAMLISS